MSVLNDLMEGLPEMGGLLKGLDRRLAQETAIPVHVVDAPLECVVLGAGKCLEAFDSLKVMFMGAER